MICPRCFTEHNCTICPRCGGYTTLPTLTTTPVTTVQIIEPVVYEFEIHGYNTCCCSDCPLEVYEGSGIPPAGYCVLGFDIADRYGDRCPGSKCPGPGKYKIVRA